MVKKEAYFKSRESKAYTILGSNIVTETFSSQKTDSEGREGSWWRENGYRAFSIEQMEHVAANSCCDS